MKEEILFDIIFQDTEKISGKVVNQNITDKEVLIQLETSDGKSITINFNKQ